LLLNILPDCHFVPTHGRDKIPTSPKSAAPHNSAVAPQNSARCRLHSSLSDNRPPAPQSTWSRNRDHHIHVIRFQVSLFDFTFVLLRQAPEYLSQLFSQPPVNHLTSVRRRSNRREGYHSQNHKFSIFSCHWSPVPTAPDPDEPTKRDQCCILTLVAASLRAFGPC
jgi:hypothetical protein